MPKTGAAHGNPAPIVAQAIASRFLDAFDLSFDASDRLAGETAYGASLERKTPRMEKGSFYRDTA